MAEYGLVLGFGIDDGQLDGLSPQGCFVLGFEFAEVFSSVLDRLSIDRPVHSQNAERIRSLLESKGREYTLTYMEDDPSEDWMRLRVSPDRAFFESD